MTRTAPVPLAVDEPGRGRLGILTTAELTAAGVTKAEVASSVRTGAWVRLRPGVLITAADLQEVTRTGRRPGLDALAVTTSLARPSAVLSGASAAWVWGLPRPRSAAATVQLTDPHRWRRGQGWSMTRATLPDDEVTRRGAYPVTTAARTLIDLARSWSEVPAVAAVDAALLRGLVTRRELEEVLDRQWCVPGVPRAVRAVALADGRAESWLETHGRLVFAALGLPPFVPQVEIRVDGRLVKVVDGWYSDAARGRRVRRSGQVPETCLRADPRGGALAGEAGRGPVAVAGGAVRPGGRRGPGRWSSGARPAGAALARTPGTRRPGVHRGTAAGGSGADRGHRRRRLVGAGRRPGGRVRLVPSGLSRTGMG